MPAGCRLRRRADGRLDSHLEQLIGERLVRHGRDSRRVQFVDHLGRRPGRHGHRVPQRGDEPLAAEGLVDGRNVGRQRRPFRQRDRQDAHPALSMMLQRGADRIDEHGDLPGDVIGDRRRAAAIGNVRDVDAADLVLEHFHREMQVRAGARRCILQLAGIGLGIGDDSLEVARHRGMHGEYDRRRADLGDGYEILQSVELRLLRHQIVERKDRRGGEQRRIAVRLGPRRLGRTDRAGGAGLVVDDDLLAEQRRHSRRVLAGEDVGRSARRKRDDHPNDAVRIGSLRHCRGRDQHERCHNNECKPGRSHAGTPIDRRV